MRIGINALYLIPGKVGGTETYLRNLILELSILDKENQYVLFTNQECAHSFDPLPSNWQEIVCNLSPLLKPYRVFWEQKKLPALAKKYQIDVLHSPAYISPLSADCATLVTIHDMHYHYYPETFSWMKRYYWKKGIPKSAKRVNMILTVSQSSKNDICKILEIPETKVRVTPEAAADNFFNIHTQDEIKRFLESKKITQPYIFCVATFNRHKNILGLVKTFTRLKQEYLCSHQLVLVGIKTDYYPTIESEIQKSPYSNQIQILDPIPINELPLLYQGAELFVLLSYFEGFGLPILESMASGTPVLCSNRTSLPEVADDAALIVDPDSETVVVNTMMELLQNTEKRKMLSDRGKIRAKEFSWRKMAEQTVSAYQEAYKIWKEQQK